MDAYVRLLLLQSTSPVDGEESISDGSSVNHPSYLRRWVVCTCVIHTSLGLDIDRYDGRLCG